MPDPAQSFLRDAREKILKDRGLTPTRRASTIDASRPQPRGLEISYTAFLVSYQREINKATRVELAPLARTILETTRQDDFLTDITTADFARIVILVDKFLTSVLLRGGIIRQGQRIGVFNAKKYDKELFRLIGINDLPMGILAATLDSWTVENLQLIKSVNGEQISKLETLFLRAARDGTRAKVLTQDVAQIMQSSLRRAALIASDQTTKLDGQLDRLKQKNVGITHYFWDTSHDERVRPAHASRQGQRVAWADPPPDGHAGQPVRCRCNARPDIETFLNPKAAAAQRAAEAADVKAARAQVIAIAKKGAAARRSKKKKKKN